MKKTVLFLSVIICTSFAINAQITDVKYLIEYNESTSLYDCKIVIIEGEATNFPQRIQFNTQYTIVVPTGTTLTIEELHAPWENNRNYMGTVPCLWEFGSKEIAPFVASDLDFHSVVPNITPPTSYNNLFEGDTVTVFSVFANIDPCENAIRPFINSVDPSSIDLPTGGDFSNGLTIGGSTQLYSGNLTTIYEGDYITENDSLYICKGDCIVLDPTICLGDTLIYEWSTGDTTEVIDVCPTVSTNYYLLVKDSMDVILDSLTVYVEVDSLMLSLQDTIVCENETTVAFTTISGGSWESTNSSIATIDAVTGDITTISWGAAIFRYTAPNGCTALTELLFVTEGPTVDVPTILCVGSSAMANSEGEGSWMSIDPDIASITENGALEALAAGTTTLVFTDSISGCAAIVDIEVLEEQLVTITGPVAICVGDTTTIASSSGGGWALTYSSSSNVASIDNAGNVLGLGEGKAVFSFISDAPGCGTTDSDTIMVFELPDVEILGDDRICIGDVTSISPNPGSTWTLSDPSVASFDVNTGIVTGIAQGVINITLMDTITGCSSTSSNIIVDPQPIVSAEFTSLCEGAKSNINASSEGTWSELNPAIAVLDNLSIFAVSEGEAGFLFTDDSTGCISDTLFISVLPKPETTLTGPNEICIGEVTSIEPSIGGTWASSDDAVATINNLGMITGINSGTATFSFTDAATLCMSDPSEEVLVLPNPFDGEVNEITICNGSAIFIFPSTLIGYWESEHPEIATIDSLTGEITPINVGSTNVTFTDDSTGCSSVILIVVKDIPVVNFIGDSKICVGQFTSVSPSSGGTWISSNPVVTSIDNSGNVEGLASGTAALTFTDMFSGCSSEQLFIEVLPESDPLCIVGLEEIVEAEVNIYPNPTSKIVHIESEDEIKYAAIYTSEYQKVKEVFFTNGSNKVQIQTEELARGLYYIAIKTGAKIIYKKIIKE